jgi:hypothetical protein
VYRDPVGALYLSEFDRPISIERARRLATRPLNAHEAFLVLDLGRRSLPWSTSDARRRTFGFRSDAL